MIDIETTLKLVGAVVAPIASASGMWAYLSARHRARLNAPASIVASQADLVAALSEQTKVLLDESAKDRRDLKRRVDRQGAQLAKVTQKVSECEDRHEECETRVVGLQAQITEIMRDNPPATYPHKAAEK